MANYQLIENTILPHKDASKRWDIEIENHKIKSIKPYNPDTTDSKDPTSSTTTSTSSTPPSLLLPSLCHPHIHLDKTYLLTSDSNANTHDKFSLCCRSPSQSSSSKAPPQWPDYAQHTPESGTFSEALQLTSKSKQLYTAEDLRLRGAQLLATAHRQGVSCVRAFVEVDHVTEYLAVEAGLDLKRAFEGRVIGATGRDHGGVSGGGVVKHEDGGGGDGGRRSGIDETVRGEGLMRIQLVAFAQDPIFSGDHGSENLKVLESVLEKYVYPNNTTPRNKSEEASTKERESGIEVLGTTPYVESSTTTSLQNIEWAIQIALKHDLHLDFHLDYNLDPDTKPMIWDVVRLLKEYRWAEIQRAKFTVSTSPGNDTTTDMGQSPSSTSLSPLEKQHRTNRQRASQKKTIVLGHVSHLTLFTSFQLSQLAEQIHSAGLTNLLSFVGLPTSDLFMMGRPPTPSKQTDSEQQQPQIRPRGTLHLPTLHAHGLNAVVGVNNLGNAFTPWGTGDPLALASLCVGLYQVGTPGEAEVLFGCVGERARRAIGFGLDTDTHRDGNVGAIADMGGRGEAVREEGEGERGGSGGVEIVDEGTIVEGQDLSQLENALLLIRNEESVDTPELKRLGIRVPARQRLSAKDVVWDPPEFGLRRLIR